MRKRSSFGKLLGVYALGMTFVIPPHITAATVSVGLVTQVEGPRWRVVNFTGPGGFGVSAVDLTNVTLDAVYGGGLLQESWPDIAPFTFVETTEPFPGGPLVSLTVDFTLSEQVLTFGQEIFTADTLENISTTNGFPPPLLLTVEGTLVPAPVPEPGSLGLIVIGLIGVSCLGGRWAGNAYSPLHFQENEQSSTRCS